MEGVAILFQHAPYPVLILDPEGSVSDINPAAVETLAVQKNRIVGTPLLGSIIHDDRDRIRHLFVGVLRGRKSHGQPASSGGIALPPLAEAVAERLRQRSHASGGEILVRAAEEIPTVFVDPDPVERALEALIIKPGEIDATGEGDIFSGATYYSRSLRQEDRHDDPSVVDSA